MIQKIRNVYSLNNCSNNSTQLSIYALGRTINLIMTTVITMRIYLYLYLGGGQLKPYNAEAVVRFSPMHNPDITGRLHKSL